MSFEDSSCSSSENISHYHTPVVDNMVYIENQKRAILIVSVKKNRFIQYDYEQLRHVWKAKCDPMFMYYISC